MCALDLWCLRRRRAYQQLAGDEDYEAIAHRWLRIHRGDVVLHLWTSGLCEKVLHMPCKQMPWRRAHRLHLLEWQAGELLHDCCLPLKLLSLKGEDGILLVEARQRCPVAVKCGVVVLVESLPIPSTTNIASLVQSADCYLGRTHERCQTGVKHPDHFPPH